MHVPLLETAISTAQNRDQLRREFPTLAELLYQRAEEFPNSLAFTFLRDGEIAERSITYRELDRLARAAAMQFHQERLKPEVVVLAYPAGIDYIVAFFGCLYAGVIAVPAYAPRSHGDLARFLAIVSDSEAMVALTMTSVLQKLEQQFTFLPALKNLRWVTTDRISDNPTDGWQLPELKSTDIAYLQYTSGSTAAPKGVMVTHRNVLSNLADIDREFQHDANSSSVSWLPPFHDMGLIYGILQPLYNRFPAVLMSPQSFIQQPFRWLNAISKYRATHCGGPNFGYDLCVRTIDRGRLKELDLTSWTVAFNGAEAVRRNTLMRFAATFGVCGFRWNSFYPAYGLAEATLKVSTRARGKIPEVRNFDASSLSQNKVVEVAAESAGTRSLVGGGNAAPPTRVVIVDPASLLPCAPDAVGEIWVSGPGIAEGYWKRPQETITTFRARMADSGDDSFLRTGDMGFLHDGELFVSGRLKDIIIIRGRNYYPEDLELTAGQSHAALNKGRGAVFSVETGEEERLIVVHEINRDYRVPDFSEIYKLIRRDISAQHELRAECIVLVKASSLPRTSSGKIQRFVCRSRFLEGTLVSIGTSVLKASHDDVLDDSNHLERMLRVRPEERLPDLQACLREQLGWILNVKSSTLSLDDPLTTLGLDSLMASRLSGWIQDSFSSSIAPADLLGESSIRLLGEAINRCLCESGGIDASSFQSAPHPHPRTVARPKGGEACHPLSIEQERLWFLNELQSGNPAYHVPAVFRLVGVLDVGILERSFAEIVNRHEILRTTITVEEGVPLQKVSPAESIPLSVVDLTGIAHHEREPRCRKLARDIVQSPFELSRSPLMRLSLIRLDELDQLLILVFHHIIADARSVELFMAELADHYTALFHKELRAWPELPIQYADFAVGQRNWRGQHSREEHLSYWSKALKSLPMQSAIWGSHADRAALARSDSLHCSFDISPEVIGSLMETGRGERATLFMTLLAVLGMALRVWTQQEDLVVGTPVAGREYPGTESLIGFFAYPIVLRLDLSGDPTFRDTLARVRGTSLAAYAHQDVPFTKIAEISNKQRGGNRSPAFNLMFTLIQSEAASLNMPLLKVTPAEFDVRSVDVDLSLTIVQTRGQFRGALDCSQKHSGTQMIRNFAQFYLKILVKCAANPRLRPSALELKGNVPKPTAAAAQTVDRKTLAIAATFTANLIEENLSFWIRKLDLSLTVEVAPYNQVFQQLLDPSSLFGKNKDGVNVVLVRLEDLGRVGSPGKTKASQFMSDGPLERHVQELISALRTGQDRSSSPSIVCLCMASPAVFADVPAGRLVRRLERRIARELGNVSGLRVVTSHDLANTYPVPEYYDLRQDRETHSPYTALYLSALGTMVSRTVFGMVSKPYKVIVLDCDGTLWQGRCGDDGFSLKVTQAQKALHRFVLQRQKEGFLICLCSKNNEQDIARVFEKGLDMPLKRDHISAWRINWRSKSENLRSLAGELRLGLDSFIFVDDDAAECAEVRANCSEVLTLRLPSGGKEIRRMLQNVWAFDARGITEEDLHRGRFYSEQIKREAHIQSVGSMADFIESLDLNIEIDDLLPSMFARASQLTMRTNQMNLTTKRRTDVEIRSLVRSGRYGVLGVTVSDRFGKYGLVGLLVYDVTRDRLRVDTFILSCRAMGKGVEHRMLAKLGEIAISQGLDFVKLLYVQNPNNQPALEFLNRAGGEFKSPAENGFCFLLPAKYGAGLTYIP